MFLFVCLFVDSGRVKERRRESVVAVVASFAALLCFPDGQFDQ